MTPLLSVSNVAKSFTMHLRGGIVLPVVENVGFEVNAGVWSCPAWPIIPKPHLMQHAPV